VVGRARRCCGISPTSKSEIGYFGMPVIIDENIRLKECDVRDHLNGEPRKAYAFEIAVDDVAGVQIFQSLGNFKNLRDKIEWKSWAGNKQ
jgi:hypothetical protein